jgi:DNA-binding transcriptional MerR regulator
MQAFHESKFAAEILGFHCPRYAEFPSVGLYMDQVLTILEDALSPFACTEKNGSKERLVTSTMINNYVKQGLVSPPQKKRYNRHHLAYLMVVCILKNVLPIADICRLIELQIKTCPIEQAYDYFCDVLEAALRAVFSQDGTEFADTQGTLPEAVLARSASLAYANKVYLQKYIEFLNETV